MKQRATVDHFENDFVFLECEDGKMIKMLRTNAPAMIAEGMVVWYEADRILEIDEEETARREYDMQMRFERILGKQNFK